VDVFVLLFKALGGAFFCRGGQIGGQIDGQKTFSI
jgi:hypothetical protein